ncbi:MAG: hypothetical protein H0T89_13725 [Deltaproteobacteria bacterium]|nr:hypothetical protein [Deltaproteobacteria bacterium]
MRLSLLMVALAVVPVTAYAEPERAKALSAEGEAAVAAGDLLRAAVKFRAAFNEEPRPEYMCNAGVAYHKLKDLPRAHRYLGQCVSMGASLDAKYRENLRRVVDSIEAKLVAGNFTPVDVVLEPGAATLTIDGGVPYDEPVVGSGRIWFPYGSYRLRAAANGYVEQPVVIEVKGHAAVPLRIELEKAPAAVDIGVQPDPTRPDVTQPDRPITPAITPPPVLVTRPRSKAPAIIATTATGALAITAALLYFKARVYVNDAEAAEDQATFDELHDKSHRFQKLAWASGGLAATGAVVSGYLWYRALRTEPAVEVIATGDGAAVSLRGRF